jgi:hypothetical protein
MSQLDPLKSFTELTIGKRVDRDKAVVNGSAAANVLFNIKGGRVAIHLLVGEITTAASGATNLRLQSNPDVGTTAVVSNVLALGGLEIGTLLVPTGAVGDAIYGVSAGAAQGPLRDLVLPAGGIEATSSGAETVTIKWSVFYVPVDDGAYVEAA